MNKRRKRHYFDVKLISDASTQQVKRDTFLMSSLEDFKHTLWFSIMHTASTVVQVVQVVQVVAVVIIETSAVDFLHI